jgi:hypothetical protein
MIYEWARIAIAAAGALSIYLGYRLFCDARNAIFGAVLALFGMGVLVADLGGYSTHQAVKQNRPAQQGSFTPARKTSIEWMI